MFDDNVTVAEFFGYNTPEPSTPNNLLITNDLCGLEIELERATNVINPRSYWVSERDGSLRNDGIEWKSSRPISGDSLVNAISMFSNACEVLAPEHRPSKSVRTSLHVHVDVRDLTKVQLMQMILGYMIWEIPIFKTYAAHRYDNHFCIPFNHCIELLPAVQWLHSGYNDFANNANHPEIGRYCAFNLKSIFKFGSVEFRHHGGEWQYDKVMEWVNTCLAFKRMAMSPIDLRATFFDASTHGFDNQLSNYFPKPTVDRVRAWYAANGGEKQLFRDIVEGIRRAQHASCPKFRI